MKKTGLKLHETSLVKFHETSEIISEIDPTQKSVDSIVLNVRFERKN